MNNADKAVFGNIRRFSLDPRISNFDNLHQSISVPSEIHAYSLGIEYMKRWFLKEFDEDYFKTVYINGKHIFDDYRRFNKQQLLKIEKPAVAIVPSLDSSFNRDTVDLRQEGRYIMGRRSQVFDDTIISDDDNNVHLRIDLKLIQMNFSFRIRVESRAAQIDLANSMKLAFRVGSTQGEYVSYDFHIPYDIILNIAKMVGFEIITEKGKRKKVKDIVGFMSYLNAHSKYPILYKMRTVNGNAEFFVRMPNQYTHISNLDELERDDGEREGQLDNNFHIEMNCILKIPAPQFYYYYSSESLKISYNDKKEFAGLYEISNMEPPERNNRGWEQYLSTEWVDDDKYVEDIDFDELITTRELIAVIRHARDTGISPSLFMEVKLYNNFTEQEISIDWDQFVMHVDKHFKSDVSVIAIYLDLEYVNTSLIAIQSLDDNRLG